MRKVSLLVVIIIAGFILSSFTGKQIVSLNNAATVSIEEMEIDFDTFNECSEEWIHLNGQAQIIIVSNTNNNRISGTWHMNMQHVTGEGLSSGTIYHVSGISNQPFSSPLTGGANTISLVTRLNMIGGGNRYALKGNYHGTMNANGTITSFFDNFSVTCK